ncbi:MAG TPA: sodium:solute symporter [Chitinophagaceae bacterium]
MSQLDWIILAVTLIGIIAYGLYKSRTTHNLDGYILANRSLPWGLVLLSIMGTQASAITFVSAPGQAYTDGMRFVQYYFGLPIAMVVICMFFVPIFRKLKVYTAYEFLENRFDGKTRTLTSFLFLLQRGVSTGISVFAPSIILSSLLGWNIYWTNLFMGGLLIIYTLSGGAKAVAYTQQLQLIVIFAGMFLAAYMVVHMLPKGVGFIDSLEVSGKLGRLNVITTGFEKGNGFDWGDKYNLWSGIIGGFFLALAYFGTDQSQVGRYLTAKSLTESRMGLLMNGLVKVPMQFAILLIGALVFTFYQFNNAPLFFNQTQVNKLEHTAHKDSLLIAQKAYKDLSEQKKSTVTLFANAENKEEKANKAVELSQLQHQSDSIRRQVRTWMQAEKIEGDTSDTNYIFLRFVVDNLPKGMVGLLIAIIFLASWGSIAAAINSLASSTMVDFHRRFTKKDISNEEEYRMSKWYTLLWGIFCVIVAMYSYNVGNSLIETVNELGSIFYGPVLGVFLIALFLRNITSGSAVFYATVLTQLMIFAIYIPAKLKLIEMGFLWLNPIGAFGVVIFALLLQPIMVKRKIPQ